MAQDLQAIDGGGYFILFDSGKIAVGGDRISTPSEFTQIVSQVFDTGKSNLVDLALSGDIKTFFSEELITQSVARFNAAFTAEDLQGVADELASNYDDGVSTSQYAKLMKFIDFFNEPYSDPAGYSLLNSQINLAEDRLSATVTGESFWSFREVTYVTHSASLDRNGIPDENDFDTPTSFVSTRNLISPVLTFDMKTSAIVTFERFGDPEHFYLYLDYQSDDFADWQPKKDFSLGESKRTLQLTGGEEFTYRVIVIDPTNQISNLTQPLGIRFTYTEIDWKSRTLTL